MCASTHMDSQTCMNTYTYKQNKNIITKKDPVNPMGGEDPYSALDFSGSLVVEESQLGFSWGSCGKAAISPIFSESR